MEGEGRPACISWINLAQGIQTQVTSSSYKLLPPECCHSPCFSVDLVPLVYLLVVFTLWFIFYLCPSGSAVVFLFSLVTSLFFCTSLLGLILVFWFRSCFGSCTVSLLNSVSFLVVFPLRLPPSPVPYL